MNTISQLTEEAVELTDLAARLNDRTADWREWNDELTCPERQEVAAEEAAIAAAEAWLRLEVAEYAEWLAARWWRRLAGWLMPRTALRWYRKGDSK
jgi:hypothetical protein